MKCILITKTVLMALLALTVPGGLLRADDADAPLPARENFYLFLLAGQSNMAGRGEVEAQDRVPHPRVLMLNRDEEWVPAVDPLHFDKPVAGAGLGRSFAFVLADANPDVTIGLIPCAAGGSPIATWSPGARWSQTKSHPYDDAVRRVKRAQQDGVLKGILWHQGESDSKPELAPVYEEKLHELIARFRRAFSAPKVPFILGQLGRFEDRPWTESRKQVNRVHQTLPEKVPHTAFVSSEGLTHKGDGVHFDSASLREFGKRYARAWQRLTETAGDE